MAIMKIISSTRATMNDMKPSSIAFWPSDGPITVSEMMSTLAAILPLLSTLARSLASSVVKLPVIDERPPSITLLTRGAE